MTEFEQKLEANRITSKKAEKINVELAEEVKRRSDEIIELRNIHGEVN